MTTLATPPSPGTKPTTPAPAQPGRWLGGGWGDADHPVEHTRYVLTNSPVLKYPYPHMHVRGVFPPDYYKAVLDHLPPPANYRPINAEYPKRGTIDLTDASAVSSLPAGKREFWQWFVGAFSAPAFMHTVLEQYGETFAGRYRGRVKPLILLCRDAGGYGIGPHTDTDQKIVTQLFYLPADESLTDFGTSIVVPKNPDHVHATTGHESWDNYRAAKTAAFSPNSMLSFAVSDRSLHAVRSTPPGTVRNSLQYFIMRAD